MGIQSLCERPMFIRATLQGFLFESRLSLDYHYDLPNGSVSDHIRLPLFQRDDLWEMYFRRRDGRAV
jgi:hypothetical protein